MEQEKLARQWEQQERNRRYHRLRHDYYQHNKHKGWQPPADLEEEEEEEKPEQEQHSVRSSVIVCMRFTLQYRWRYSLKTTQQLV